MASKDSTHPQARTRINQETINKAVNALLKWNKSRSSAQKPQLLEQDQFIYLVVTLKKIPPKGATSPHKIPLPHPLHAPPSSELCLIIDDRSKSNLTSEAAKKKVKSEDIPISKVLKLSKLKSDYREFEKKRKLCDSYDMFLADKRLVPLLPKVLGKQFFKKKKIPVQVNLTHNNWKEQIERACGSGLLYLRTGTCSAVRVARACMDREEIVENVVAAIDGVAEIVPKKWANVRSFHVKFSESLALPVYQAFPNTRLKIEGIQSIDLRNEGKKDKEEAHKEKVNGKSKKVGNKDNLEKGRIPEIRCMDDDDVDSLGEDELSTGDNETDGGSEEVEDDKMSNDEAVGKKRMKGGLIKGDGLGKISDGRNVKKLQKIKKEMKNVLALESGEQSALSKEKKKAKAGRMNDGEVEVKDNKRKKILAPK